MSISSRSLYPHPPPPQIPLPPRHCEFTFWFYRFASSGLIHFMDGVIQYMVPSPTGKPPLWQGNRLGQKGSIWSCRKRVKRPICGRPDRVRNIQMVRNAALRALDRDVCSQVCKGGGIWSVGIGEQAQSESKIIHF